MSSLENCVRSSAHFLIGMFGGLILSYMNFFYVFVSTLSWIYNLQPPSPVQWLPFGFVDGLLPAWELLSTAQSHPFTFAFVSFAWGDTSKKNTAKISIKEAPACFLPRVSGPTCKSFVHSCIRYKKVIRFHSSACSCPLCPIPFFEETFSLLLFLMFVFVFSAKYVLNITVYKAEY